jgi:hypothetical protein
VGITDDARLDELELAGEIVGEGLVWAQIPWISQD